MNKGLLAGQLLLTGFFGVLLCGFIVFGRIQAQEVIVARETKPEVSKQATPAPEETPSELPTPEPPKPRSREKKPASAEPTLEQMRMAGALAAERLNNPTSSQPVKTGSEASPTATPVVPEPARPARKETRPEQLSESRRAGGRIGKPGTIGPVRTTLMESGRTEPTATPSPRVETPTP